MEPLDNKQEAEEYEFTEEEIKMFYERRQKRLNGESKCYTVTEAFEMIRQKRKSDDLGKSRSQDGKDELESL